ncbi:MAG: hypothetical protein RLY71_4187 [Pseudomonadota bacterium]|jgi:hypothetical protein
MPLHADQHPAPTVAVEQQCTHRHGDSHAYDLTDLPEPGPAALADILAGLLGLVIAVLAVLIACGWLTTLCGAVLLAVLLLGPLILVLAVLLRA